MGVFRCFLGFHEILRHLPEDQTLERDRILRMRRDSRHEKQAIHLLQ